MEYFVRFLNIDIFSDEFNDGNLVHDTSNTSVLTVIIGAVDYRCTLNTPKKIILQKSDATVVQNGKENHLTS